MRLKMSKIKKDQYRNGVIPWNKGKKMTQKYRNKVSQTLKGLTGEKSRNWKGGVTPIVRSIRNSFRYRQWRSDCLTRDDYICQLCGKKGGILNVDHNPKSFAQIISDNNLKSINEAISCEELWNINNGRTLCIDCHKKTDTYLKRLNR